MHMGYHRVWMKKLEIWMYIRIPAAKPPQQHLKLETTRITILCPAPWPKLHSDTPDSSWEFLAAKGRWWQIQEILLTLSVTNVKKAGREDHHTSVHNGLKLDLCCVCVCHENLTSIRLHQHEVLHPSPNLLWILHFGVHISEILV